MPEKGYLVRENETAVKGVMEEVRYCQDEMMHEVKKSVKNFASVEIEKEYSENEIDIYDFCA